MQLAFLRWYGWPMVMASLTFIRTRIKFTAIYVDVA